MNGTHTISCRIDVLRKNVFFKTLDINTQIAPQVNVNNSQVIKRELRATFRDDPAINLITDRFAPYIIIDGIEYPLGKFIASEAPKSTNISTNRQLVAYGVSYLADQLSKLESRTTISAGTKYTDAIRAQIIMSGITDFIIEDNDAVITEDREDWEMGDTRISIINKLLSEINYHSMYDDNNGTVRIKKYQRPSIEAVGFHYVDGKNSIMCPENTQDLDMFSRHNVFIRTCENPEKEVMVAVAENKDPSSPVSIVNVGRRIVDAARIDNIATQKELQYKVDNLLYENLLVPEFVSLPTGPNPKHDCFNIISVDKGDVHGIYQEQSWSIKLLGSGQMQHRLRRVLPQ